MKDIDYLLELRRELALLIKLQRKWDKQRKLPSSSPKVYKLRRELDEQAERVRYGTSLV